MTERGKRSWGYCARVREQLQRTQTELDRSSSAEQKFPRGSVAMNASEHTLVDCIELLKHENETVESALRRLLMDIAATSETKEIQKSTERISNLVARMSELTGK